MLNGQGSQVRVGPIKLIKPIDPWMIVIGPMGLLKFNEICLPCFRHNAGAIHDRNKRTNREERELTRLTSGRSGLPVYQLRHLKFEGVVFPFLFKFIEGTSIKETTVRSGLLELKTI